jgi:hypothetical protein
MPNPAHFSDCRNQGSESAQGPSLIRQQGQEVVVLTRRTPSTNDKGQSGRSSPSFAQEFVGLNIKRDYQENT